MKKLFNRYTENYSDRTVAMTSVSLSINALIGFGKLALGIYLSSAWFMTNSGYYLLLCAARGHSLRRYSVTKQIENAKERYDKEFATYKRSGIFLCLMGISYLLVCLRMYLVGDSTVYKGYTVYLVATVAFTKMGFAIYGTVVTRHLENPIISTIKIISFTDAFVSIVVTESTLLSMQGTANSAQYSAITGMAASALFVLEGICMLTKKRQYPNHRQHLKKQKRHYVKIRWEKWLNWKTCLKMFSAKSGNKSNKL